MWSLWSLDVTSLNVDVDVGVVRVLVDGGDGFGVRKLAIKPLVGHVSRLVGIDALLKRQDCLVVGPSLAATAARPFQLVGFPLLAVLLQLVAQLVVVLGVAHFVWIVAEENGVTVFQRGGRARDVAALAPLPPGCPTLNRIKTPGISSLRSGAARHLWMH